MAYHQPSFCVLNITSIKLTLYCLMVLSHLEGI